MTPKRGDRAAPPPSGDEWDVRFDTAEAAKGWEEFGQQAASAVRTCFDILRTDPAPQPETARQHRLRGRALSTGIRRGVALPQWEYEVTGGGRVRYLVDVDNRTVWLVKASIRHPKDTE